MANTELTACFVRLATMLGKEPYVLFVVLGEVVTTKSNSLKMLSRVLAPTKSHPPMVTPATLLKLLNEEMLRRHQDDLESFPALVSIDVLSRTYPSTTRDRHSSELVVLAMIHSLIGK